MPEHKDIPVRSITMPDGRVIANLTAEEYDATYIGGTVHEIPADALAAAIADAAARGAQ